MLHNLVELCWDSGLLWEIDLDCFFPQYSGINLVSELMAKDGGYDREIEELKIQIKRLEEQELRFRRR